MAEALVESVIENLGSLVKDQLAIYWGVDEQTEKLSSNLKAIRAVLRDAERKQITSYAVKDWLQKLTDAAYVLDDILDECSIHSTKMHFVDGHTSLVSRLHPKDILFRFHIGKRMREITQRFHSIHEERLTFELRVSVTEEQTVDDDDWRQTSSVITEPILYGRDEDREKIVKFLLKDANNNEDLTVYPIVGMGGLGKTTLAKQVFNDHEISKHFDLRIWICVSDDFNLKRILQSIIECCIGQNPNLGDLEARRKKVEEALHNKRYLLVLDDVWNENPEKWKELKGMLECARGAKGATILVTTRLEEVVSIMGTHSAYRLTALSEDDSWSLFKHHAFGPNREEREELVTIGKEIMRKCVGSPLAIKTLASCLRDESEVSQWENVKKSEIWNIREESSSVTGDENSIMRVLKLSYSNLKSSVKRCFSFCAIFPKDFEIDKEELIHLWMANGFIKSEGDVEVEDVGNKVWRKLYSRSFFQEAKYDEFGMITSFKMHDLFHDLAQSIMGEECVVIEASSMTMLSARVHYSSLFSSDFLFDRPAFSRRLMPAFKKVESLRTFLDFCHISSGPSNHYLRALCLRPIPYFSPYKDLANKDLAHLRYLSLSFCFEKACLNSIICQMPKLQILKLNSCTEVELPKNLTQLQDLRHVLIDDCASIAEMPPNISKLRHLRTLGIFVVGSKPGCGLGELQSLKLGGTLRIKGLENVSSEWDAKQANLIGKNLNMLWLSWDGRSSSEGSNVSVERVLEALEPPSTLKSFQMNGYEGRHLSSWMRSLVALRDLVEVKVLECDNVEELPPLGKLPHLKRLELSGMKNVKCIDGETYDGAEEKAFPSLEELSVDKLPNLERLLRDERVEMVPHLFQLRIQRVSNLKCPRLPSVEKLYVISIDDVEGVVGNTPCLKTLNISSIKGVKTLPDQLGTLDALEVLEIEFWYDLEYFPEHVLEGLTSLRTLEIRHCEKLKSLSEGVRHLACLQSLMICNCPELVVALPNNMSQLTALRDVSILYCSTLPDGLQRVPSLRSLYIFDCKSTSLPDWLGDITSLQQLDINLCRELRSLPSSIQRLTNLSHLIILGCPHLEKRCKRETGEDWQYINHIPNIKLFS